MDAELVALASAGSSALVQAMATDAWEAVRDRVARLYGRAERTQRAEAAQLDEIRAELLSGDQGQALDPEAEWRARLSRLLAENPRAAGELRRIVDEFTGQPGAGPQTHNTVSGGTAGHVVQAGVINSLTLQAAPEAGDVVDLSDGTFNGSVVGVQHNHHYGTRPPTDRAAADEWPRIGQLRRLDMGIHPTRRLDGESYVPPYVARDCDGELNTLVRAARRGGGFIVVTGEPLSGKTRTAWAALARNVRGDVRVCVAPADTELRDLPARLRGRDPEGTYVVWLDDLAGHLGEHGLTAGLLAQLTQEKVLVVATMNDDDYDTHRFGGGPTSRVLRGAGTVQLSCRWSEAELKRLAEFDDPRLVDARERRGDSGVTQFLALGPELWDEWRRARQRHPVGYLLVRAAVDLARCGITRDIPEPLLRAAFVRYEEAPEAYLEGADVAAAFAWVAAPRHGVTGLLVRGTAPGTWRAYGSLIADAVRWPDLEPVPDLVWGEAVLGARTHGLGAETVSAAYRAAMLPLAEDGDLTAMTGIASLAHLEGDAAEAETWYRKAADLGDTRACNGLGQILANRGAAAEAIGYLEIAAEAGLEESYTTLGKLHRDRARHWLTRGAETGDAEAAFQLAHLVLKPGSEREAAKWYRRATEAGHRNAVTYLNTLRAGIAAPEEETE
ncbi:sel1 repeat family protein [Streptomyces sp. NPDC050658]|uniref:tetratricopeptide repeat protein n=1 Tax=unclassified Streptomyces TaxID=2593676 RepID=UPI003418DDD0